MLLKLISILCFFSTSIAVIRTDFAFLPSLLLGIGVWVGSFVIFALIAVAFLWICCARVDFDTPQTEDSPFYRKLAAVYVEALIQSLQVRVHTEGLEKTPKEGRFLLVCNHLFIADPGILLHYFKDSQLAFITKKENQALPFVGPIMHKILCQPLDRENDRQALRSIINCINIIKQDKASIAVFPEGGTSKDGKLHHFRHGAFKIALKTKVPIVVCTIQGTRNILKNGLRLKPTDVRLHLVEVIGPEEYGAMTTVALGERIYHDMLDDLGADFVPNT